MATIRKEINIVSGTATGSASGIVLTDNGYVQLDTTQFNNPTYYFEIDVTTTSASGTVSLRRKGTTTDDASVSSASAGLARSSSFTPPAGQTEYGVFSADTTVRIWTARIIIIDNSTSIAKTETQYEIGTRETAKANTAIAALSSPKYWTYTAANWDGTATFLAEVTSLTSAANTHTVRLEEDDGSFGVWSTKVTIVSALSNTAATRRRSVGFTPTDGRHYRISALCSTTKSTYSIYNAKIIVQQTSFTKFEDYYQIIVGGVAGTGIKTNQVRWNASEWAGVTNTYKYSHDATNALDTTKLQDMDNANADVTSATATGANQQISALAFSMPADTHRMRMNFTVASGNVLASRIIVASVISTAALTGTITASATETDIVTGGKTIILTLTGDTWVASGATFDAIRQDIIDGLDSAQAEANGWDAVVKATQGVAGVVRTSNTVVTITLDAFATYDITSTETITATIPSTALTGASAIVATPTFTVSPTAGASKNLALLGVG